MDFNELYRLIERDLNQAIENVAQKMKAQFIAKLNARPASLYYDRTGELIASFDNPPKVRISKGSKPTIRFYNIDNIKARGRAQSGHFGRHQSFDGTPVQDFPDVYGKSIVQIQEDGYWIPRDKKHIAGLGVGKAVFGTQDSSDYLLDELEKEIKPVIDEYINEIQKILNKGGG